MGKVKPVYYAHSKLIYGSKQERDELTYIRKVFYPVICPNNDMGERSSIEPYLTQVQKSSYVVCSEVNEYIGKGVYQEISEALRRGIPVLALRKRSGIFKFHRVLYAIVVDDQDWKYRYAKIYIKKESEKVAVY